jgi:hypothetical protein
MMIVTLSIKNKLLISIDYDDDGGDDIHPSIVPSITLIDQYIYAFLTFSYSR